MIFFFWHIPKPDIIVLWNTGCGLDDDVTVYQEVDRLNFSIYPSVTFSAGGS